MTVGLEPGTAAVAIVWRAPGTHQALALSFLIAFALQPATPAPAPPPRESFADLPGVRLCYRDTGGSEPPPGSSSAIPPDSPRHRASGPRLRAAMRG